MPSQTCLAAAEPGYLVLDYSYTVRAAVGRHTRLIGKRLFDEHPEFTSRLKPHYDTARVTGRPVTFFVYVEAGTDGNDEPMVALETVTPDDGLLVARWEPYDEGKLSRLSESLLLSLRALREAPRSSPPPPPATVPSPLPGTPLRLVSRPAHA